MNELSIHRVVGSSFMVGGWVKMSASKKRNLDQNINDSKSHIWNSFFENIFQYRAYNFFMLVHTFQWTLSEFFFLFFNFLAESQKKLAKKFIHFAIQFCSKNLTNFMKFKSLEIESNMLSQHNQKLYEFYFTKIHFTNFPVNVFLFGVRKHLYCIIFWLQRTNSSSTLKANVCIYLYISVRKYLFQRRSKIFSGSGEGW